MSTPFKRMRNEIANNHGITKDEAETAMYLDAGEEMTFSNGKKAHAVRNHGGLDEPDEYYVNIFVNNSFVHQQYHYEG